MRAKHFCTKLGRMNIQAYVESLKARLAGCKATREDLAQASGGRLSTSWISKFASGARDNPTVATLVALDEALQAVESTVQDRAA